VKEETIDQKFPDHCPLKEQCQESFFFHFFIKQILLVQGMETISNFPNIRGVIHVHIDSPVYCIHHWEVDLNPLD
jgi:hypothetical protein